MPSIVINGIEHFKIPGYEDYFISKTGSIFSKKTIHGVTVRNRFISSRILGGFKSVSLYRNGVPSVERVHRLLAITFLPIEERKPYAVFKNGIKSDIRIENIEWSHSKRKVNNGEEKNTI